VITRASTTRIAVVVSGWPRLSESFALNELLALKQAGMLAGVFATKRGDIDGRHPAVAALDPYVTYLSDDASDTQQADELVAALGETVDGVHGYFAHQPAAVARLAAERLGVPFGFSAHAKDPARSSRPSSSTVPVRRPASSPATATSPTNCAVSAPIPRWCRTVSTSTRSRRSAAAQVTGWSCWPWVAWWSRRGSVY